MVVNTYGVRNIGDILFHDLEDSAGPVTDIEGSGTRINLGVVRLHGLMEEYFVAFFVDL